MEKLLQAIAASLRNLGFDAHVQWDRVVVGNVEARLQKLYRPVRYFFLGRYFERAELAQMVLRFTAMYASMKRAADAEEARMVQRRVEMEEKQRLEAEAAERRAALEAVLDDYRNGSSRTITVTGYLIGDAYVGLMGEEFVTFAVHTDAGRALISADYLSEMVS